MSQPRSYQDLTPAEVEERIRILISRSTNQVEEFGDVNESAALAKVAWEIAFSRAVLEQVGTDGTVIEKESRAKLKCEAELLAYRSTEAIADAAKEAHRATLAHLTGMQTIAANQRAEFGAAGSHT